jgi:hypothetical protein
MATVLGIWLGLTGAVPALAGLAGLRRVRRLHRHGVRAWATAVRLYPAGEEYQVALRYALPDGRVLENPMGGKTGALLAGERVLIWHDRADPMDALVHGRNGRVADLAFVVTGAVLAAAGAAIAIAAP